MTVRDSATTFFFWVKVPVGATTRRIAVRGYPGTGYSDNGQGVTDFIVSGGGTFDGSKSTVSVQSATMASGTMQTVTLTARDSSGTLLANLKLPKAPGARSKGGVPQGWACAMLSRPCKIRRLLPGPGWAAKACHPPPLEQCLPCSCAGPSGLARRTT